MAFPTDNPMDGRRTAAAEPTLKRLAEAFQIDGIVSAWPDGGWPDDEGDDHELDDEEWIVGIALSSFSSTESYAVEPGKDPGVWRQLALVRGRRVAEAFADLLNAARGSQEAR